MSLERDTLTAFDWVGLRPMPPANDYEDALRGIERMLRHMPQGAKLVIYRNTDAERQIMVKPDPFTVAYYPTGKVPSS